MSDPADNFDDEVSLDHCRSFRNIRGNTDSYALFLKIDLMRVIPDHYCLNITKGNIFVHPQPLFIMRETYQTGDYTQIIVRKKSEY